MSYENEKDVMMQIDKKELVNLYSQSAKEACEMRKVLLKMNKHLESRGNLLINRYDNLHKEIQEVSKIKLTLEETYALERIFMGEDRGFMNSMGLGRLLSEDLVELDMDGERLVMSETGLTFIRSMKNQPEHKSSTNVTSQPSPKPDDKKEEPEEDIMSSDFNCPN